MATSNIAEAGTLTLEWSTLSSHIGDQTYANLAVGAVRHIANLPDPLPGMANLSTIQTDSQYEEKVFLPRE
ncbi:hypothetical protein C0989_012380 [Termitomyces sp. Mn162]|nr:hypothetical protein C0989_012380 [Termitomyces sp. Mn162]